MALSILDGNQSATTLSTILSSGQHITAHTVVSLGTQAITDMRGAVSGSVVSISNLPATQPISIASVTIGNTVTIAGTVTANPTGIQTIAGTVTIGAGTSQIGSVTASISNSVTISSLPAISGTVTANGIAFNSGEATPDKAVWIAYNLNNTLEGVSDSTPLPISGTVTVGALPSGVNFGSQLAEGYDNYGGAPVQIVGSNATLPISGTVTLGAGTAQIGSVTVGNSVTIGSLPALVAGTAQIGVVTVGNIRRSTDGATTQLTTEVGSGYLEVRSYIGAGTAQIGSVTASISGTVPISISSVTVGNSVTIGSLPAISGTVTANTFALQGTAVTTSNFTSTTASTVLASFNATREVLTIFNEGAGNLHICAGATCTTIAYQVRLSAGDYYEVPNHQTTITHSAVFATAGTARIVQIS
jgi:hypothetical protein